MKIDMVNDKQIKCLINKKELNARNIDIENLSYGSDDANNLFDEILEFAKSKYNFFYADSPLVIEAIPLKEGNLLIIITKSDDPEEIDTRFSKFTPTPEDIENASGSSLSATEERIRKANEALNLLSSFTDELLSHALKNNIINRNNPSENNTNTFNELSKTPTSKDISLAFVFENINKLISLCKIINPKYHGNSSVYRKESEFYLLINSHNHSPEEFNQICNIICEYGAHTNIKKNIEAYFTEHYELIIENDAINQLAIM